MSQLLPINTIILANGATILARSDERVLADNGRDYTVWLYRMVPHPGKPEEMTCVAECYAGHYFPHTSAGLLQAVEVFTGAIR